MEAPHIHYRTKQTVKVFNKPGINPTTKDGSYMNDIEPGILLDVFSVIRGWLAINEIKNRWVMESLCIKLADYPPPDDDDPPPPPPPTPDEFPDEFAMTIGTTTKWYIPK